MTNDFQMFADPDGDEAALDPDVALITAYLARELSPMQVMAVEARLASDAEFRAAVQPLLDGWAAPVKAFEGGNARRVLQLSAAEKDASWLRFQGESRAETPVQKKTITRVAAIIALTVIPLVGVAQIVAYFAKHADSPGHNAGAIVPGSLRASDEGEGRSFTLGSRAQVHIPIRQLSAPVAVTKEPLGFIHGVIQFADGRILLNDIDHRKFLLFNSTLSEHTVTADLSGTGSARYPAQLLQAPLYYYLGDSAVYPDIGGRMFIVIGPDGKPGRAMAHASSSDMASLNQPLSGAPAFDPRGRLVYRARSEGEPSRDPSAPAPPPPPPRTMDTSALVRADFETRRVDTLAPLVIPTRVRPPVIWDGGKPTQKLIINPNPPGSDEWAVLTDGTIGIISPHDYHIDWIAMDGSRKSTPKMPFDWRRYTEAEKRAKIDSVKHIIDSVQASGKIYYMGWARNPVRGTMDTIRNIIEFVPLDEMLDYPPAVRPFAVKADRDNHLWIIPTTSLSAVGGGPLYDVVSKDGVIVERVQLPPGMSIAGFGKGGVVYLQSGNPTRGYTIEKRTVVRAK